MSKKYKSPQIRKYFVYGALVKLISGQLLCLLYIYYYRYGDTLRFWRFGEYYKDILFNSNDFNFVQWLFMDNEVFENLIRYQIDYAYAFGSSSFMVNKISGIISMFTFGSYMSITLFFSMISFSGSWKLFVTFCKIYPRLHKDFAVAIIFFPSVVFWGSGVLKDSLCIFGLGWLTWGFYHLVLSANKNLAKAPLYLAAIIISFFVLLNVKTYIIVAYLAGMSIWVFLFFRDKISNSALKLSITPILLGLSIPAVFFGLQVFSEQLGKYALENVLETAVGLSYVQQNRGDAGSTYSLGDMDASIAGLLAKFPAAINVTLFRPYLWESRNPIMLFAALESAIVFFITLVTLFKVGVFRSIGSVLNNGTLMFCFVYSLVFSVAVGISSSNFGTLMRYKIPSMPFYIMGILILYHINMGHSFFDRKKQKGTPKVRPKPVVNLKPN